MPTLVRPARRTVFSRVEGWDAAVDYNFTLTFGRPFSISAYASLGELPDADEYDRCLAVVHFGAGATDYRVVMSINGTWVRLPVEGAYVTALTDESGGTSGGDTIAEVTDVATAADAVATLAAKLNSLLAALKASDAVDAG